MRKKKHRVSEITPGPAVSRGNFLSRILMGSVAIGACSLCSLSAQTVPGTRAGAPPQGNGCCKHRHCRYYRGPK